MKIMKIERKNKIIINFDVSDKYVFEFDYKSLAKKITKKLQIMIFLTIYL